MHSHSNRLPHVFLLHVLLLHVLLSDVLRSTDALSLFGQGVLPPSYYCITLQAVVVVSFESARNDTFEWYLIASTEAPELHPRAIALQPFNINSPSSSNKLFGRPHYYLLNTKCCSRSLHSSSYYTFHVTPIIMPFLVSHISYG